MTFYNFLIEYRKKFYVASLMKSKLALVAYFHKNTWFLNQIQDVVFMLPVELNLKCGMTEYKMESDSIFAISSSIGSILLE